MQNLVRVYLASKLVAAIVAIALAVAVHGMAGSPVHAAPIAPHATTSHASVLFINTPSAVYMPRFRVALSQGICAYDVAPCGDMDSITIAPVVPQNAECWYPISDGTVIVVCGWNLVGDTHGAPNAYFPYHCEYVGGTNPDTYSYGCDTQGIG